MDVDAGNLSQQVQKSETDEDADAASAGFVFAGLARAYILWFKKSTIMIPIKKQAFLQIGRLTHTNGSSVAKGNTADNVTSGSKPLFFHRGLTKELLAKSAVLGITVFGTYEYLIQHYMKVNGDTNARSTVLVHMGADELSIMPLDMHLFLVLLKLRDEFYSFFASCPLEETHLRATSLLATTFLAGGIAGQVHHFVNYVTSHWKLQLSSLDLRKHAQQCLRLPNRRANLAAFGPTALCFVAFHFGEELTERMRDVENETEKLLEVTVN